MEKQNQLIEELVNGKISYNDEMKKLKKGDFVLYNTGIKEENSENTKEMLGIVLYEASSEYGLQIALVSEDIDSFEKITLGDNEDFRDSYNEAIKVLNDSAEKYVNPQYALSGRALGSNPKNKNNETTTTVKMTVNGEEIDLNCKDLDENYIKDVETIEEIGISQFINSTQCWYASRYVERGSLYGEELYTFGIRSSDEEAESMGIIRGGEISYSQAFTRIFIPCILLRGDLKIISGNGIDEPYQLGIN